MRRLSDNKYLRTAKYIQCRLTTVSVSRLLGIDLFPCLELADGFLEPRNFFSVLRAKNRAFFQSRTMVNTIVCRTAFHSDDADGGDDDVMMMMFSH